MAFNIDQFRSQLTEGGARPTLFEVLLTPPSGLSRGNANAGADQIRFMCKASTIPSTVSGVIEVPYFGRKIKYAGDKTFEELSLTIINDENFAVHDMFENWMSVINENVSNLRTIGQNPTNYQVPIDLIHYGKTGDIIKEYRFHHAFPTNVAQIDLSWENNDQIEEYTVSLQYNYFTTRTTDQ